MAAEKCGNLSDFVQWVKISNVIPSLTVLAFNGAHQNRLEKKIADNDRSISNSNFQSLDHFPAASHVTHPVNKQLRQTELQMAISINKHLQRSQYSRFCYITTLHNNKCSTTF